MKITKYQHACLVVEDNGKVIVIDPGNMSILKPENLDQLDYMLVTHDHQDHMHAPLIKQLVEKFPNVKIIGPSTVKSALEKEGLKVATEGDETVGTTNAIHNKMLTFQTENYLFTLFGRLSHPGDSFHFDKTAEILALPFTAPWGSTQEALELALKLKPKTVIPIHDWLIKDEVKGWMYQMAQKFLGEQGISFILIEDGKPIEA